MNVYRGIVKGNVVVLNEEVRLADGLEVEVRVPAEPSIERERELLRERGLLKTPAVPMTDSTEDMDRTPIVVQGAPVSRMIIEERR